MELLLLILLHPLYSRCFFFFFVLFCFVFVLNLLIVYVLNYRELIEFAMANDEVAKQIADR